MIIVFIYDTTEVRVQLQPTPLDIDTAHITTIAESASCVWHPPSQLQQVALRDSLLKWNISGELMFHLNADQVRACGGRPGESHSTIQRMMDARAWGEAGRYTVGRDEEEVQVLDALQATGVVQTFEEHASHVEYSLTDYGLNNLKAANILRDPSYCFRYRPLSEHVTLHDLSTYELMDMMHDNGWRCHVLQRGERTKDAGAQPYVLGSRKVWLMRVTKASASRPYLISLLSADQTFPPIEHFRTDASYEHLLLHKQFPAVEKKKKKNTSSHTTRAAALADLEVQDQAIQDREDKPRKKRAPRKPKAKGERGTKRRRKANPPGDAAPAAMVLQDIVQEEDDAASSSSSSSSTSSRSFSAPVAPPSQEEEEVEEVQEGTVAHRTTVQRCHRLEEAFALTDEDYSDVSSAGLDHDVCNSDTNGEEHAAGNESGSAARQKHAEGERAEGEDATEEEDASSRSGRSKESGSEKEGSGSDDADVADSDGDDAAERRVIVNRSAAVAAANQGERQVFINGIMFTELWPFGMHTGYSRQCSTCSYTRSLTFAGSSIPPDEAVRRLERWESLCPGADYPKDHQVVGGRLLKACADDG